MRSAKVIIIVNPVTAHVNVSHLEIRQLSVSHISCLLSYHYGSGYWLWQINETTLQITLMWELDTKLYLAHN